MSKNLLNNLAFVALMAVLLVHPVMSSGVCAENSSSPSASSSREIKRFTELARQYRDWMLSAYPSLATYYGIHKYDTELEDLSDSARKKTADSLNSFYKRFSAIDFASLDRQSQIDWNLVVGDIKSKLLELETIQSWKVNPDIYSSSANSAVFNLVSRKFAPLEKRLVSVIARESKIPQLLELAKKNLVAEEVPKIYAQIALEQMPGIVSFFKDTMTSEVKNVKDEKLKKQFEKVNDECIAAFKSYEKFIKEDILPRAKDDFAIGEKKYLEKLYCEELVDQSIDKLLARGEAELSRLQNEFVECARKIDPKASCHDVYVKVSSKHPKPNDLIKATEGVLEEIRSYCVEKPICTIPGEERAQVAETPAFMRALTFAAMDTPGPFEKKAKEAYYYVTLPEKDWDAKKVEEHMRSFSTQDLLNTSIHEAYPGHYTQFLWVNRAPSEVRKMYGCSSNAEGWAHYCEQMMIDEGFKNNDPELKMAQVHDALLRVCRYIAGIKMHTRGMSLNQAIELFEKDGYQEHANAEREAKRGCMDPTYLVYTLGKLDILAMRDEMLKKQGKSFDKRKFHDDFLKQGYPPLVLVRACLFKEPIKKYF